MAGCLRFGEFELHLGAFTLRRAGEPVRLEKLPMDVLILLATHAGALVSRDQIEAQLWGRTLHGDHGAAINTAVRKIRRTLGDAAEHPRIIETVVGRGYRFVAPVERTPSATVSHAGPGAVRVSLPAAYDAYVRGRHAWEKRGEANLREAVRWFQQSIDADPTYAWAYVGLADSYGQLGYGSYVAPEEAFPRVRAAARRALELDPSLAAAHAALGFALMYYDWDFGGAEAAYREALALDPGYAIAHQWYAYLLTALERPFVEAEGEIATAKRLDPLSVAIHIDEAYILHYYGRNDAALRAVNVALDMNPAFPLGHFWRGRILAAEGRYEEADAALLGLGPLRTWAPAMAVLGYLYSRTGRTVEARAILDEFADMGRAGRYVSAYAVAVVHAGLADREAALQALETARDQRSHWLVWLKRDPRWHAIRSDQRFQTLVRQIGLPA
jgi:DNA-binding winged helix-turn-helix (wHTH) protein/Flp pilus assembly protein TadD